MSVYERALCGDHFGLALGKRVCWQFFHGDKLRSALANWQPATGIAPKAICIIRLTFAGTSPTPLIP